MLLLQMNPHYTNTSLCPMPGYQWAELTRETPTSVAGFSSRGFLAAHCADVFPGEGFAELVWMPQ
jgi:hypothetical protein